MERGEDEDENTKTCRELIDSREWFTGKQGEEWWRDSTDVVEMDAASNNSVENIRAIRQEVIYASTGVKYKVYIAPWEISVPSVNFAAITPSTSTSLFAEA